MLSFPSRRDFLTGRLFLFLSECGFRLCEKQAERYFLEEEARI